MTIVAIYRPRADEVLLENRRTGERIIISAADARDLRDAIDVAFGACGIAGLIVTASPPPRLP